MRMHSLLILVFVASSWLVVHAAPPKAQIALDLEGPLGAVSLRVEVRFDRPMDVEKLPQLRFRKGELEPAEKSWIDEKTFAARFSIPANFPNGENALEVSGAADDEGETVKKTRSATFVIDTRPPITDKASLKLAGGQPYTREATFAVVPKGFKDKTTEITAYYLSGEDGGGTRQGERFEKQATYTAAQDGEVVLYAWTEDSAGNLSAAISATIVVDTQAPGVVSAALDRTGVLGPGVVRVTAAFSEDIDPDAGLEVRFGPLSVEGSWTDARTFSGSFKIGKRIDDGEYALAIEGGTDRAGNPLVPFTGPPVQIDRTPPDISAAYVEIEGGSAVSADKTLEFIFDGFADNTRIVRFFYADQDESATGGGTQSQDGRTGVLADAPEGPNRVYVWAEDAAGNISRAVSAEILVDTERPSVEEARVGPPATAGALPVKLRFNRGMDPTADPSVVLDGQAVPGSWVEGDTLNWQGLYEIGDATQIGSVELIVASAFDLVGHPMREDYRRSVDIPGDAVYLHGMARREQGDLLGGEAAFDRVLAAETEHVEARYERAMLYGEQGRADEQLAELEQVVRIDPYVPKAHYALAGIYTDRDQLDQAGAALEKVVAIEQGSAGSGSPYAKPNRDLMSLLFAPFELVRGAQPTQYNVLHQSGVVSARNGDLESAATKLQQAIGAGAGAVARYNLGTVFLHQALWSEAEVELEEAESDGAQPLNSVRINLGAAQIGRGRFKQAEKTYAEIGSYPDPTYLNNLAVLQAKRGHEDEALTTLNSLSATDPAMLVSRGSIFFRAERYPEAEAAFQQVLVQDPSYAEAHLGLGRIREAQQDFSGARDAYRAAIAAHLEYVDAHYRLGQVLLQLGDPENAAVEFQRAVNIAPDFAEARAALGSAYKQQGLDEKAQAQYQKASEARKKSWTQRPKGMKVALLRFANETGDSDLDYLSVGLPEGLTGDLLQISDFDLIDRQQVEKIMQQQTQQELVGGAAGESVQILQAEALISGNIRLVDGKLHLSAKLTDAASGQIKAAVSVSGKKKKAIALGRELAAELAQESGTLIDPELQKQMLEREVPSEEAFRLASEAKEKLYAGDEAGAQALSAQALEADASALDMVTGIDMIDEAVRLGKTIAIFSFEYRGDKSKHAQFADILPEALTQDLGKIAGLYVVERGQVHKLQEERTREELGQTQGATEAGQLLGAGLVLLGSFHVDGKQLIVSTDMVSVDKGYKIVSVSGRNKVDKFNELTAQLVIDISQALQVEVSKAEKALLENKPAEAVEALKQLVELRDMQVADVEGQTVAVRPFSNVRRIAKYAWLSDNIADGISAELMQRGLPLVGGRQSTELEAERNLIMLGEFAGSDINEAMLARDQGARYLVKGNYVAGGRKKLRIESHLWDTQTNSILAAASIKGTSDELLALNAKLVDRYMDAIEPEEIKEKGESSLFRLPTKLLFTLALTSGAGWGGTHYMFDQAEKDYLSGENNYDDTNRYYRSRRGLKTSTQILASSMVFSWLWNHTVAR